MTIQSTMTAGVLTLTIDRMSHRNTLTSEDFLALAKEIQDASLDPNTRVVLIKGQPGIFCAGADLKAMQDEPEALHDAMRHAFDALEACPKPLVAEVDGPAVAEGLTLLLYCDLVYASSRSLFSMPSVAMARTPYFGAIARLMMLSGPRATSQKLLLSEPISIEDAMEMQLVSAVYEAEDLAQVVASKVARLAVMPKGAVARVKSLMSTLLKESARTIRADETAFFELECQSDEAKEALAAFMEHRKPVYH